MVNDMSAYFVIRIDVQSNVSGRLAFLLNIRNYYECEGRIEKSVPRIAVWHHEACRVMTNGDPEGRIFLSHPHTNIGLFSCSPLFYIYIYLFIIK